MSSTTSNQKSHVEDQSTALNIKETICDILASVIGSAACVYSGQPFDTIKVRLQVNPTEYSSLIACIRKTIGGEGITALWRGSLPAFTGALSENVVAFATNGLLKRIFQTGEENKSIYEPFITGGITGVFSAAVLCPCDVIKCRAQVNIARGLQQQSITAMTRSILATHGPSGLYVGFRAQLLRDIPFYSSFFGSYDILCAILKQHTDLPETSIYFVSGG
jgi:solute carrier family 25 (mitochondrial ornithine transporter) member 2/15